MDNTISPYLITNVVSYPFDRDTPIITRKGTMNTYTANSVAVMGADVDYQICKNLTVGDHVLIEINGQRMFGYKDIPLLASVPWAVIKNTEDFISLSHPAYPKALTLHYANLQTLPGQAGPAVFIEVDPDLSPTPFYAILQLVSHYLPSNEAEQFFVNTFDETLLETHRARIVKELKGATQRLRAGWGYIGKRRFALRTGASNNQLDDLDHIEDRLLVRVCREFGWMDSIKKASSLGINFIKQEPCNCG